MVNTPIPHSLRSEAKKAAKILREFSVPSAKSGPDKLIPAGILLKAKGLAILTVVKAGFLVTARGGSGIVIAKRDDSPDDDDLSGGWTAPSAIGIAGLGGGFEIGAEVTDFVIILNNEKSVEAFSKGGNLTLGGNFTIAAGPLGRNLEGDIAVRSPAAIYTYSKTRGIFAGISVEGSALIERKDANRKFYGEDIRAVQILSGEVDPPQECAALYEVLRDQRKAAMKTLLKTASKQAVKHGHLATDAILDRYGFSSSKRSKDRIPELNEKEMSQGKVAMQMASSHSKQGSAVIRQTYSTRTTRTTKSYTSSRKYSAEAEDVGSDSSPEMPRHSIAEMDWMRVMDTSQSTKQSGAIPKSRYDLDDHSRQKQSTSKSHSRHKKEDVWGDKSRRHSAIVPKSHDPWGDAEESSDIKAIALHPFSGEMPCDLVFRTGDEILVLTRTETQHDWWEGFCNGKTGIFPANFVKVF